MTSQIAITFGAWLALNLIGMNLIGMLARGLAPTLKIRKLLTKGSPAFGKVVAEFYKPSEESGLNIIAFVLIVSFLSVLFYFWNIGVVFAAVLIMVGDIPDMLWKMKHGRVGGSQGVFADIFSRSNSMNGNYSASKNGYGLGLECHGTPSGSGLLERANLADAVIASAKKNGINTKDRAEASLLGEFVVAVSWEGKATLNTFKNMPPAYHLNYIAFLAALPVLWYSLYRL
jgi:hypothetical protein